MKKWYYHFAVKFLALLLAALSFFVAAVSGIGIFALVQTGAYEDGGVEPVEVILVNRYSYLPTELVRLYLEDKAYMENYLSTLQREVSCEVEIFADDNVLLYSNRSDRDYRICMTDRYLDAPEHDYEVGKWYQVSVYVLAPGTESGLNVWFRLISFFNQIRFGLIWILFASFLAFVLLLVFLCCSAGRTERGDAAFGLFHRVPLEFYLAGGLFLFLLECIVLDSVSQWMMFFCICVCLMIPVDILLLLPVVMSFAVRCKRNRLRDTTLLGLCFSFLKKGVGFSLGLFQNVLLTPKVALLLAGVAVIDFLLTMVLGKHECYAVFFIEGLLLSAVLIWYAASVQRLEKTAREIAQGNLSARCDLTLLPPGLRSFGEKLNSGAEGMEKAVEEKLKSERFKTELITNVSHDIKTPLTSIVNFVDLMKKEKIDNEKLREYLDVLDRQSARLKKLTEDLVESAKAASGALPVELSLCDVSVLLSQAMGEYQAKLEEKGLTPCFSVPEEPCFAMVDGNLLWRVLDNLFRNIVKYALPGTRVYVTLEEREGELDLIFRNISASALPVSGAYLTERFVRGDPSRNTEGSGLGLSIAHSLTQLQKGKLTLTVDGDLFKAVLTFSRVDRKKTV